MDNYQDAITQMREFGLNVDDILTDGRVHRVTTAEKPREKAGWYACHEWQSEQGHFVVGSFGIFVGPDNHQQKIKLKGAALSQEASAALRQRIQNNAKLAQANRAREADRAALRAQGVWAKALTAPPSSGVDYIDRKGISAYGLRYTDSGALVIPLADANRNVRGLQFILPAQHPRRRKTGRDKEYWPTGMQKQGCFYLIGSPQSAGLVLICEGYATGATLHAATGLPVAIAFDAGNLKPVAEAIKKHYRIQRFLICADDDYLTEGNPGATKASLAALAVGGEWIVPVFPGDRAGAKLTDFNDLQQFPNGGLALVGQQIEARLAALGWSARAPRAAVGGGGEDRRGRPSARSIMALDEIVERFIPLDDGTGKYVWDHWNRKIASREQMIAMLPAGVRGDDLKRHPVWLERGGVYLDQVGFDPTEQDNQVRLNTWHGWPMQPQDGVCDQILDTIYWLCSAERNAEEVYRWLLCWLAYPLQHPGAKMASAVIMHGPQGTGKTSVFKVMAKIYGDYAVTINQRSLEDRFNADWADSKLFVIAEEIAPPAEKYHVKNELKDLVTGESIRVNPKNIAAYFQKNLMQFVFLSNEKQPLPLDNDDRRHLVVHTPPAQLASFYDGLYREIDSGGVAAFYHYLLHLDLGDFHPKKAPPLTQSKIALQNLSASSEDRFMEDWLHGDTPYPVRACLSTDLYSAYQHWCRRNGEQRPRASNHFYRTVELLDGWRKAKIRVYEDCTYLGGTIPRNLVVPARSVLEAHQAAPGQDKTEAQWLTDHYIGFSESLKSLGYSA